MTLGGGTNTHAYFAFLEYPSLQLSRQSVFEGPLQARHEVSQATHDPSPVALKKVPLTHADSHLLSAFLAAPGLQVECV